MNKNIKSIDTYLLDLDGTIYLSDQLIDGALEFLKTLKAQGKSYIFLTNNSSKSKEDYYKKLINLGIELSMDQIFTSGNATIHWIKKQKEKAKIFLLGTKALQEEFQKEEITLVHQGQCDIDYVVLGFDTTLTYEKLWIACDYIRQGVPFVATHPDLNCPLKGGNYMPDTGAMIKLIEASTNVSPIIIGKPHIAIINAVLETYGLNPQTTAMVGDRIYTDIQMAINASLTSILVFSGETTKEELENSRIKPSFHFDSVQGITESLYGCI